LLFSNVIPFELHKCFIMKILKNTPKNWFAGVSIVCLSTLLLSSCLKSSNNDYYNPPVAYFAFIQASPDEPPVNLFLNNNQVNFNPLLFDDYLGYVRAYTGLRTINVNNASTMTQILSDTAHLYQNQYYTMFMVNKPSTPQTLLLKDTLTQPASGKAIIRFVNVSPDAGAVDLWIQGGAKLVQNKAFKGYSAFIPVSATAGTLQVTQAGTSTVLATLPAAQLLAGSVYTIWLYGLANTTVTGEKLGINITCNANY